MWGWLTAILKVLLPFLWDKAEQPNTIEDEEQVPDKLRSALDADLANKLRDKQSSDSADGSSSFK